MRLEKGPGQTYNATSATVKKKKKKKLLISLLVRCEALRKFGKQSGKT